MLHSSVWENSSAADLFHLMFPYGLLEFNVPFQHKYGYIRNEMFPYSDTATWFKMPKYTNSDVVTYGLCPYFQFQDQLVSGVKRYTFLQCHLMKV